MKTLLTSIVVFISCGCLQAQHGPSGQPGSHEIVVEEVLQTEIYTYILAKENGKSQWMAMPKTQAEVGKTYYYQAAMEMKQFNSKALDRTFDSILFVDGVVTTESLAAKSNGRSSAPQDNAVEKIAPVKGAITIAELFENKSFYNDMAVKVTGKVTKFNKDIMQTNWIHLQDGTGLGNDFDLTITSNEVLKVGDIVTLEGKIALNQDIGSGYFYKVLMTEAKVVK